jgi:hypothetical protein
MVDAYSQCLNRAWVPTLAVGVGSTLLRRVMGDGITL